MRYFDACNETNLMHQVGFITRIYRNAGQQNMRFFLNIMFEKSDTDKI
jgi:hypothetical protein